MYVGTRHKLCYTNGTWEKLWEQTPLESTLAGHGKLPLTSATDGTRPASNCPILIKNVIPYARAIVRDWDHFSTCKRGAQRQPNFE